MTDISTIDLSGFRELQRAVGQNATDKGFRQEGIAMSEIAHEIAPYDAALAANQILANYFSKRLNLIHDELSEAHEEIRNGHAPTEEYENTTPGKEGKPEGVPSELADIVIRTLDLADEYGIDLADVIVRKAQYNATREALHGKKF